MRDVTTTIRRDDQGHKYARYTLVKPKVIN
jgi:hypothetical protein